MTDLELVGMFKCLADKSRLQILQSLAKEDMYVERLAERLALSASTVSFHLKKLQEIGAVTSYRTQYYTMYALCKSFFDINLLDILCKPSEEADMQNQRENQYRQKVIDTCFDLGKLKSLPTQLKKRKIVLEVISGAFAYNKLYSEREVNIVIADYYDDFCTIRRDLVEFGLLSRKEGMYWRK